MEMDKIVHENREIIWLKTIVVKWQQTQFNEKNGEIWKKQIKK